MRHIFQAPDGTIFDTEAECRVYEAERLAYRAFDKDGEPTYDLSCAKAVYIYPNGADKLEEDLKQADLPYSGFGFRTTGWVFLCEDYDSCDEWTPLSEGLIRRFSLGTP